MTSKPHNAYNFGYTHIKHHAWRTAENSAAYLLPTLQQMVEAQPEISMLDVGAGPGTISASFANYMPQGHITASDISEAVLVRAEEHAKSQGVSNVSFKQASVFKLVETFGHHQFDIVHAHQVLCHLSNPIEALSQMLQVAKPGGIVALRECDLRMFCWYPETDGLVAFREMLLGVTKSNGAWVDAGPRLVSWAMKAGANRGNITASMGTWCYSETKDRETIAGSFIERLENGEYKKVALENNINTQAEIDSMIEAWRTWISTEDATFGSLHGELLIRT